MPDYSRRQMRREYAADMRRIRTLLLSVFSAAVIFLWVMYIGKADRTPADVWLFACLPAAAALFVMGLYLVFTGDGWLLRHTPYGRALLRLGNARERMLSIDREALNAEDFPDAVPLESWLILYLAAAGSKGAPRLCAWPIPRDNIDSFSFSYGPDRGVWMTVYTKDQQPARVLLREEAEIRAVMQWIKAQEMAAAWNQ